MKILVLKTNINSPLEQERLSPVFDRHPAIYRWTVDTEDCDKVLRIEAADDLSYDHVCWMAREGNFQCEELTH